MGLALYIATRIAVQGGRLEFSYHLVAGVVGQRLGLA